VESEGFERLVSVSVAWGKAPSAYLSGLTGLQAFWVDEAAAVWVMEVKQRVEEQTTTKTDIL